MRPEQRGRVKQPHHGFNWRQEEIRDWGKAFHHPEKAGVRGLQGRQGQRGLCRRGPRDDRRLRKELERQSVPDLEPDVVGKLLPAACQGGGHSEEEWRGKDGVPTVADRVAQMVVKTILEPVLEPVFLSDSYGYRPGKSALDAIAITRNRCWRYDWVLEFDIKGLFDNISHDL